MSLRKWASLTLIVLSLMMVACGGDDPSPEEAQAALCDDLDSMATALTSLVGLGTDSSIEDLQGFRDDLSDAWDDVVDSANDVGDAEVDQLEEAYDTLRDTLDDLSDNMSIADAIAALQDPVAAVTTAWNDLRTATDCS